MSARQLVEACKLDALTLKITARNHERMLTKRFAENMTENRSVDTGILSAILCHTKSEKLYLDRVYARSLWIPFDLVAFVLDEFTIVIKKN